MNSLPVLLYIILVIAMHFSSPSPTQSSLLSCKCCFTILKSERNPTEGKNEPRQLGFHWHTNNFGRLNISRGKMHHQDWRTKRTREVTPSTSCTRQCPLTHKLGCASILLSISCHSNHAWRGQELLCIFLTPSNYFFRAKSAHFVWPASIWFIAPSN